LLRSTIAPSGESHYSIEWLVWESRGPQAVTGHAHSLILHRGTEVPPPPEAERLLAFARPSEAAAKFAVLTVLQIQ